MLTRRSTTIAALAAPMLASIAQLAPTSAGAVAPRAGTPTPGWFRMGIGDFEVTALSDGAIPLEPKKLLLGAPPSDIASLLALDFHGDTVQTSVNAYAVHTGERLILVDAGAGTLFGPTVGKCVDSLVASGYRPEQVDAILVTHMHVDHVGGLTRDGALVFPNATVHADRRDAAFWLSEETLARSPAETKDFVRAAMASFKPWLAAGRLETFDGGGELYPGVRVAAAPGHTPGHTVYAIESRGQQMRFWGDLMHVAAVQFRRPHVAMSFDLDPKAATVERRKAYADAARGKYWVAAAHLPYPGIGRLRAEGRSYVFVPADVSGLR